MFRLWPTKQRNEVSIIKLLFCRNCKRVFSLTGTKQDCPCGECGGVYPDGVNAQIWGNALPLGFDNTSFFSALGNQPEETGMGGRPFTAFVIEQNCPTVEHVERASDPPTD